MSAVPRPTVSVGLHPDRPIAEVGDLAAEAERLGYEGVWIADSQSLFRDVYAALTVAAMRTSRESPELMPTSKNGTSSEPPAT